MTKEDYKNFEKSTKYWICDNAYVIGDVKWRDRCHISGKYGDSADRECNINVKVNHEIPIVFNNLNNCDLHLIMQEIGKVNLK